MPSITSINKHAGYTTGGQEIVVAGTSLNGTAVEVKIDGNDCAVTS